MSASTHKVAWNTGTPLLYMLSVSASALVSHTAAELWSCQSGMILRVENFTVFLSIGKVF